MRFKDHFSGHADQYATYRPRYPRELYRFLARQAPARECAWDCATGNGQAALGLAVEFQRVVATDASAQQLAQASSHPRLAYVAAPAERVPLRGASIDLITAAQALHWFDVEGFYAEVRRVARPGAVLAVWAYSRIEGSTALNRALERFYSLEVGPYWLPERALVESGYRTLPFPFDRLQTPSFEMHEQWQLQQLLGYLRTWSASQRYLQALGRDPVSAMEAEFRAVWGADATVRPLRWAIHLLAGRIG